MPEAYPPKNKTVAPQGLPPVEAPDLLSQNNSILHKSRRATKFFESSNHLGNVLSTFTDRRLGQTSPGNTSEYYEAEVVSATDYYPFGFEMPGRIISSDEYRFGFNGKEKDEDGEWGGLTHYDYGFRIYNPGIARFLSVDPLTGSYPWYTPYQFAGNKPIWAVDLDGLEPRYTNDGRIVYDVQLNQGFTQIVEDLERNGIIIGWKELRDRPGNERFTAHIVQNRDNPSNVLYRHLNMNEKDVLQVGRYGEGQFIPFVESESPKNTPSLENTTLTLKQFVGGDAFGLGYDYIDISYPVTAITGVWDNNIRSHTFSIPGYSGWGLDVELTTGVKGNLRLTENFSYEGSFANSFNKFRLVNSAAGSGVLKMANFKGFNNASDMGLGWESWAFGGGISGGISGGRTQIGEFKPNMGERDSILRAAFDTLLPLPERQNFLNRYPGIDVDSLKRASDNGL